ncbi:uncharacterized protein [Macrobrachium rosenbergii]|uniref:uncharacterized protein n=1 Tax=Macrobrachium rosenbergii TaxID=79674 RepID=UPI0034D65701
MVQVPQQASRSGHFHRTKRPCPLIETGIAVPNRSGTPMGLAPPGPPSALPEINSLPVPLVSSGQCQAPPISAGSFLPSILPMPGPELVPVPDPEPDLDPPMGDPPNLTTMIIAQCEPPTPDGSSFHTLLPAKDDPLAGLDITSFLVDQELSGQNADAVSLPTTVVAAAEVGDQPVAPEAALILLLTALLAILQSRYPHHPLGMV